MTKLYRLTKGDRAIFQAAKEANNPNILTNFYMRHPDSGTWWRRVFDEDVKELTIPQGIEAALRWQQGYETLLSIWKYLGKPYYFAPEPEDPEDWKPLTESEYTERSQRLDKTYRTVFELGDDPVFHHLHGALLIPWQLEVAQWKQAVIVEIGGFASGKTLSKIVQMLCNAVTLPGYRGFALGPYSKQAEEVHKIALQLIEGTEFEKRFLIGKPTKPYPKLIFRNDMTGITTIECYSIKDDVGKLLTLTADEAIIDQAEMLDDIDEIVSKVGSRFRGQVRGRPRIGQMTLVANSADNPMLWDWFDEGQEPGNKYVKSYAPNTFENTYLTVEDLKRFENTVAKDEVSRRLYLFGERPLGAGEHFPRASLEKCRATWMDTQIDDAMQAKTPGYIKEVAPRVGVYKLGIPYNNGDSYLVAADAGWSNPPNRNSAVIGVWKYTDFPYIPAQLVAFSWVFGNNSPIPWMQQYTEYVQEYHAIGMNGFDATGFQSGYERMTDIGELMPTPVSLTGQKKYTYLNLTKKIMAQGKFQIPTITHLFSQCAKYVLPDDKLRQDIVMMLLVTAAILEPLYYIGETAVTQFDGFDPGDRFYRDPSRYESLLEAERY